MSSKKQTSSKWDTDAQEIHGGQEWADLVNFVEDFSVTTNFMNTPESGLNAIKNSIKNVSHYPSADQEPAKSDLAKFLNVESSRLLLGNGASEVIDLVTRFAYSKSEDKTCLPGYNPQYKEYERSATTSGFEIVEKGSGADLLAIVNPCNPTGQYKNLKDLKEFILENVNDNGFVIVDESMQPWVGKDFLKDSLLSAQNWVESIFESKGISVYVIHSWTKLWSCTGLRIGSIVCPTTKHASLLKKMQVPWSVNCFALDFISAVVKDHKYLADTWTKTPILRKNAIDKLKSLKPHWKFFGESFLSWIWVSIGSEEEAIEVAKLCKNAGVPIRVGSYGYKANGYVRFAVRESHQFDHILKAIKK
eukprot:NODE_159_length_15043_cov_0.440444.p5 type:complete len:362 gc:universal NODE_159_length_15043_cov_0.440444:13717-14802(+)